MRPAIVAAGLLVAACARLPTTVSDGLDAGVRRARLAGLTHWEMSGRLAVDTGERAFQARFRWLQAAERLTLTVRGPLNAGSFQISGTRDSLTVVSRGERRVLDDPEAQLSALFGWWLPVTSLEYWLLGRPDERFPAAASNGDSGELVSLVQRRWRLDYTEHQVAAGVLIPRRLRMAHEPLSVEVVVDRWEPEMPAGDVLN